MWCDVAYVLRHHRGGGCGIRTREGVNPTRFPNPQTVIRADPHVSVHAYEGTSRMLTDASKRRRLRSKLRPRSQRVPRTMLALRNAKRVPIGGLTGSANVLHTPDRCANVPGNMPSWPAQRFSGERRVMTTKSDF